MSTFALTLHAGYRCRSSGECGETWAVPAEPHVLQSQSAPGLHEMVEAFRKTDLLLLHGADSKAFAREVLAIEGR